ncbi:MAG: hypothetical protein WA624_16120 [Methylocella sp.]
MATVVFPRQGFVEPETIFLVQRQDLKKIGLRSIIFLAPRHKFGGEGVAVR